MEERKIKITTKEILGNPEYQAVSYGGYRQTTRDIVPTVEEIKDDMRIMYAMGIRILRTYNTQQYDQASNILKAIRELRNEDPEFEMYVMLGAWIECEGAWTATPNHEEGNLENNEAEVLAAVNLAKEYPEIVKVLAVGNEAMVHWAASYFVYPKVILKWVDRLQDMKKEGELENDLWITSSDNFASWGGGDSTYHNKDLNALIEAVDFISLHTYPFHDTHYNPEFWNAPESETDLNEMEKIESAMVRARDYAISQHNAVKEYVTNINIEKPIHIGETGWASEAGTTFYGSSGSRAADEYKGKLYHDLIRDWTNQEGISCFYFEAFDEQWKDPNDPMGSENHFGLISLQGEAKYVLWDRVDDGVFDGLTRDGNPIIKSYSGDEKALMEDVLNHSTVNEESTQMDIQ